MPSNVRNLLNVEVSAIIQFNQKYTPVTDSWGAMIGYILPDGRMVKPMLGFEIQNPDGTYHYTVNADNLGIGVMEYGRCDFS